MALDYSAIFDLLCEFFLLFSLISFCFRRSKPLRIECTYSSIRRLPPDFECPGFSRQRNNCSSSSSASSNASASSSSSNRHPPKHEDHQHLPDFECPELSRQRNNSSPSSSASTTASASSSSSNSETKHVKSSIEIEEPLQVKYSNETEEPFHVKPSTETEAPLQVKSSIETEEPLQESSIETEESLQVNSSNETEESLHEEFSIETDEPLHEESSTETEESLHEEFSIETDEPLHEESSTKTEEPLQVKSSNEVEEPLQESSTETEEPLQVICEICAETKRITEMIKNQICHHSYCSDCMTKHVATKIQESITAVPCPGLDCNSVYELEACRLWLPKDLLERWDQALCESLFLQVSKFYCPFKDCLAMMLVEIEEDQQVEGETECHVCHRMFCPRCDAPWHTGVNCEEYQKLNENERQREDLIVSKV